MKTNQSGRMQRLCALEHAFTTVWYTADEVREMLALANKSLEPDAQLRWSFVRPMSGVDIIQRLIQTESDPKVMRTVVGAGIALLAQEFVPKDDFGRFAGEFAGRFGEAMAHA